MILIKYPEIHAWKRARTNHGNYYDAQLGEKLCLVYYFQKAFKKYGGKQLDGPLYIIGAFYRKRPQSHRKNNPPILWDTKPDIDNLFKFILDVSEHQAKIIKNDSRICFIHGIKLWGKEDGTACIIGRCDSKSKFVFTGDFIGINNIVWDLFDLRFKTLP